MLEAVFWACFIVVVYTYLLYPLALACLSRLRPRAVKRGMDGPRTVSFIVCANNEHKAIERRLLELIGILEGTNTQGEIIVVSDGSTDETAAIALGLESRGVRVEELPTPAGKAAALTRGVALAKNDIVVFADVRQTWAPEALELLLENFADPRVGAVSGDLIVVSGPGALSGVSLYWRFEKWLRQQESRIGSQVGVTGAISAVRRELFRPIPAGTLLDDVYWPLAVVMQRYRVVHDSRALAYDRLPERVADEFRRKVRTLAGNFQLVARMPSCLLPWRNPAWAQLLSHKLLRLAVPWALLGMFVCNLALEGQFYFAALASQVVCYGVGVVGLVAPARLLNGWFPGRVLSAAASFLVLNAAAAMALGVWISGRASRSWRRVSYSTNGAPTAQPASTAPIAPCPAPRAIASVE
jgi:cellulose synthase/poly-beta-1,6-N-acetylglucosamine synthase-like glycosyltransferase